MHLTNDVAEFATHLKAGDVIVYDTISSISRLVQWADAAQANHCSVMYDDVQTAMANDKGTRFPDVIRVRDVREFLGFADIRGAVALRHHDLASGGSGVAAVRERVDAYLSVAPSFSVMDLVALFPAALVRAYTKRGLSLPDGANQIVLFLLTMMRSELLRQIPDDNHRVTCSEFVYRCLAEAGLPVAIDEPIVDPQSLLVQADSAEWGGAMNLVAEQQFWEDYRHPTGNPPPVPGMQDADYFDVRPDLVTPGDFWCSTSFQRVAQLAKVPPDRRSVINDPQPERVD